MNIFFDTEFTGLRKDTDLISIGMVTEDDIEFYAEVSDYRKELLNDWLEENVIANLFGTVGYITNKHDLQYSIRNFFKNYCKSEQGEVVYMWSDCLAYDWVLFCDIFGSAFHIPKNVYYIPFDICTLFQLKGIDPDINREEFSELSYKKKHNALLDARIIKACYEKLMKL